MKYTLRQYEWSVIRTILAEYGMKYLELEFLIGWIAEGEEYAQAEIALDDMLAAAQALDVRHLKIGPDMHAKKWAMQRMIDRFGRLCDKAAVYGTAVVLEPVPWSNVADLETAVALVELCPLPLPPPSNAAREPDAAHEACERLVRAIWVRCCEEHAAAAVVLVEGDRATHDGRKPHVFLSTPYAVSSSFATFCLR